MLNNFEVEEIKV